MAGTDDINTIFQIVDSDGSGYLDKEKLQRICPHLSPSEIETIFDDLDTNRDNRISLTEFTHGFKGVTKPRLTSHLSAIAAPTDTDMDEDIGTGVTHTQINEVFNNLACQEQVYDFYETLRNGSGESVEQFQSILEAFVCDILKYRKEIKRLEDSYKRDKETNEKYLKRIEEDQDRETRLLEEKIRKEEQEKFDTERSLLKQQANKEIANLQASLQRMQTVEKRYADHKSDEDSSVLILREEIAKLTSENQTLNGSLNDSITTVAILQSDLQSMKSQLNERHTMLLQEKVSASGSHREKESLQTNLRHLVEVNKSLRDENDTLRASLETSKIAAIHPANLLTPMAAMKDRAGSVLENYWSNPKTEVLSPSYLQPRQLQPQYQAQARFIPLESFDLESADELGMRTNGTPFITKSGANVMPLKMLSSAAVIPNSSNANDNNTMNDSGLSLGPIHDATEIESDRDKIGGIINRPPMLRNTKINRSMPARRYQDDTDTDTDVFISAAPFDRNNRKRWSQDRPPKRNPQITRSLTKDSGTVTPTNTATATTSTAAASQADKQLQANSNLPFDRMFKVVFCGDAAVGKSTLIMRLCKGKFVSSLNSTLGVDFQNKQLEIDGKRVAIQLWDTAGQERFRSVAKSYFRRCDGVLLVYDCTYERSFLNVREWIDTITDATPKKVPVMIVANKIDLRDQLRAEGKRVIEREDGVKLAKEYKALFIETSAKDGTNSDEGLIELARDMQSNEDWVLKHPTSLDLNDKPKKKAGCC